MKKYLAIAALCSSFIAAASAEAATYVYVGSWNVADGPLWSGAAATGKTPSLSAQETAAYLFGGVASDYAISTAGTAVANIDFLSWVDGYADASHLINPYGSPGIPVAQNFVGNVGGDYAAGFGNYSAYIFDHACGSYYCDGGTGESSTNYAFRIAAVPEPMSWAMMVGGFGMTGAMVRRRQQAATSVRFG